MNKINFEEIIINYKKIMTNDPIFATNIGIHNNDCKVSDLSCEKFESDLLSTKELLEIVKNYDNSNLDFECRIDLKLMILSLERKEFFLELNYNGLFDYEQKPILGTTIIDAFLYLFLKDLREDNIRLDIINTRLEKLPNMIKNYKLVLKKVVSRWKDIEIEELNGINDLFDSLILWAKKINYENVSKLENNISKINSSINDYLEFLNSLEVIDNFIIGKELAQKLANLNGIDFSLDEIYNLAKNFFKSHNEKINSLVEKIKIKYNLDSNLKYEEVLKFLKNKYSVPIEFVVDTYKNEQNRVLKYLENKDLFVFPKSHELKILKTPSYLVPSIPVGAMFPPASFENGPKISLVYVTIDKARAKDQNSLMITNTMIHEGIPGHHLQLAMAGENNSIVRKLADFNTHAEGWTTYLEKFMTNVGFVDEVIKDDYELIALADFSRLGARVAIDLFFMTGEKKYLNVIENFIPNGKTNFELANSLLQKATGFSSARCVGELNWYSKIRGYPMCYLLGNIMLNNLKNELKKSNPNLNEIEISKIFHKYYLKEGVMTHSLLREILVNKGLIK